MAVDVMTYNKEYHHEYYLRNREKHKAQVYAWRAEHPEEVKAIARKGVAKRLADPEAKARIYKANKEWRLRNPKEPQRRRAEKLAVYGLTLQDYDDMMASQGNVCATCGKEGPLDVDHCHKTGIVRGLLCRRCNIALAYFEDPLRPQWEAYLGEVK